MKGEGKEAQIRWGEGAKGELMACTPLAYAVPVELKEVFEELKRSLREANLIKRRQLKPGRVFQVNPESDIVRLRGKLGLSPLEPTRRIGSHWRKRS